MAKKLKVAIASLFIFAFTLAPSVFAYPAGQFGPVPAEGCPSSHYEYGGSCYPKTSSQCKGLLDCIKNVNTPNLTITKEQGLVGQIINLIIPIVIGAGAMLTVIFIIISGIQFVTSGGDPKGAAAAKDRLVYALVGFAVLVLAYAILQIVDKLFLRSGIV